MSTRWRGFHARRARGRVGASGVDEVAWLPRRAASELSGGRYLFLTDDSGVGGPHKEPTLPCYLVTKLDRQEWSA